LVTLRLGGVLMAVPVNGLTEGLVKKRSGGVGCKPIVGYVDIKAGNV
jgi:hypothetical protein